MLNNKKVVVVLPAYNAARTLRRTVDEIPREIVDEVILTDDASRDNTSDLAREMGLITIRHDHNRGVRRQPEDLLAGCARAGRGYCGDAAPRLPIHAQEKPLASKHRQVDCKQVLHRPSEQARIFGNLPHLGLGVVSRAH